MTADEMLAELAKGLEQRLENQAQWHALVLRLEAWRAEARIAGHNAAVEAMQAQLEDAVSAEREACAQLAQRAWESDYGGIRGITNLAPLIRARN